MRRNMKFILAAVAALLIMTGCGKDKTAQSDVPDVQTEIPTVEPADPTPVPTPEKTKKYKADDFSLQVPVSWEKQYEVEEVEAEGENDPSYLVFYAKKCHEETGEGMLFSIGRFKDESYKDLNVSARSTVGKSGDITYVAIYPTKAQAVGVSQEAKKQYYKLFDKMEKVAASLLPEKNTKKEKKKK